MYLYIGQETVIKTDDIIGIFDIDKATVSRATKEYLTAAQKENRIVEVNADIPKSFVVCGSGSSQFRVYLSQISPSTLRKRADYIKDLGSL